MGARARTAAVLLAICAALAACAGAGSQQELRTASDTTAGQKLAGIRLQLAIGYYQDGKYEVALDEIKKALSADPEYADAYGMRGLVYNAMGQVELADQNFKRALAIAPYNPDLSNNYGWFLCQNGKPEQSIRYFESAIGNRSYRTPASAMVNAGTCSLKLKDRSAAERYLLDALRVEPDLAAVNAGLARIYFERGDMTRATFFTNRLLAVAKPETMSAADLWLAIRVERKLGDKATETALVAQLSKRFPGSPEYAAFTRGAFDE